MLNRKSHKSTQRTYNQWANLENCPAEFAQLLNAITRLRGPATYFDGPFLLSADDARELRASLARMADHVSGRVFGTNERGPFRLIATRALESGEMLSEDDYSVFPQPSASTGGKRQQ
ncbi:hypothetical protein GKE82_18810 [Conexibacter sp. W3-3-2]|uniref:hypothetical protein n=1 Tax=Conexibacter sp. W3-3-2 TaxID=2675227 RepID=UPI0012B93D6F|nr:hypothetical protein [Conexibacter sp. W3-3-2]MTD46279.1 hypothetical protein [Conexibacter sp. W3-3-2]